MNIPAPAGARPAVKGQADMVAAAPHVVSFPKRDKTRPAVAGG
jgi:hypothetical protein